MKYMFSRIEEGSLKKYEFSSYQEIEKWVNQQLEDFKKINRVFDESKDRAYMEYKSELQKILNIHEEMDDYLKCKKCTQKDHEDIFCRCEERNIRIARKKRLMGEDPWKNVRKENATGN